MAEHIELLEQLEVEVENAISYYDLAKMHSKAMRHRKLLLEANQKGEVHIYYIELSNLLAANMVAKLKTYLN